MELYAQIVMEKDGSGKKNNMKYIISTFLSIIIILIPSGFYLCTTYPSWVYFLSLLLTYIALSVYILIKFAYISKNLHKFKDDIENRYRTYICVHSIEKLFIILDFFHWNYKYFIKNKKEIFEQTMKIRENADLEFKIKLSEPIY